MNKDSLCRIVAIDGKQRHELPQFLKSVPTLYVPDTKDVYVGKDIYAYIAKPVTSRREVPVQQKGQSGGVTQGSTYRRWRLSGPGPLGQELSHRWLLELDKSRRVHETEQNNYSFLGVVVWLLSLPSLRQSSPTMAASRA
jgi:hypothetical protein